MPSGSSSANPVNARLVAQAAQKMIVRQLVVRRCKQTARVLMTALNSFTELGGNTIPCTDPVLRAPQENRPSTYTLPLVWSENEKMSSMAQNRFWHVLVRWGTVCARLTQPLRSSKVDIKCDVRPTFCEDRG